MVQFSLMNFPSMLETERPDVTLRRVTRDNVGIYLKTFIPNRLYISRSRLPSHTRPPAMAARDAALEAIKDLIGDDNLHMGIWDCDTFVGSVSLTPDETAQGAEIGCWVDERQAGRGYARLALQALAEYGQSSFPKGVRAEVAAANEPGIKLVERSGFRQITAEAGRLTFEFCGIESDT